MPHARLEGVLLALMDMGLGGLTYYESKGRGAESTSDITFWERHVHLYPRIQP
jgi:hypothetical protein